MWLGLRTLNWGKYCEVAGLGERLPGPREQLPEAAPAISLESGGAVVIPMPAQPMVVGGWVIFIPGPNVRARVPQIKPGLVSYLSEETKGNKK